MTTKEQQASVDELVAHMLAVDDDEEQHALIMQLHASDARTVVQACSPLFEAKPRERALGCEILAQLQVEDGQLRDQIRQMIAARLSDTSEDVVAAAVYAFFHLGTEDVLVKILPLSKSSDPKIREAVAVALSGSADDDAVKVLVGLSADEDDEVRNWATFGLGIEGGVDTPQVREALVRCASDPHLETRHEAILGLARRGDARVAGLVGRELAGGRLSEALLRTIELAPRAEWVPILRSFREEWLDCPWAIGSAVGACRELEASKTEPSDDGAT